jgi:hypothetical protein
MLAVDVHQHLWPEPVLEALARRSAAPRARRCDRGWQVELQGEPPFLVDPAEHDPGRRSADLRADRLDQALVALSSPVGIEVLPPAEAEPVLDAWHVGALGHPGLGVWGAVALRDHPAELALRAADVLDRGAIGIVVSAGALGSRAGVDRLGALLALLEDRMCPLFVHPGPGTAAAAAAEAGPAWWAPATTYVAQLHAAWHAVAAWARPDFPRLHVVFAALAGLAPLHAERTALRGGPALDELDARTFYDASSYGPRALRAMAAQVGTAQLVHGTDVPVVPGPTARPLGHDVHERMRRENAARLLGRLWVAA